MAALDDARLYLCTDSRARQGDLADFLDTVLAQRRRRRAAAREGARGARGAAAAGGLRGRGANGTARCGRSTTGPTSPAPSARRCCTSARTTCRCRVARAIVGADVLIGRSTHSPEQADAARVEDGVAYYCCGPDLDDADQARPPGRRTRAARARRGPPGRAPWFAIGGIETLERLDEVIALGARRAVVVRAITEAEDPGAAAAAFAARLRATP